jgi:hypothetical protein
MPLADLNNFLWQYTAAHSRFKIEFNPPDREISDGQSVSIRSYIARGYLDKRVLYCGFPDRVTCAAITAEELSDVIMRSFTLILNALRRLEPEAQQGSVKVYGAPSDYAQYS